MNWKDKIGAKVVFTGKLKMLPENSIGILDNVIDDWGVIVYTQYSSYEEDGNGGFKPIKGKEIHVFAHSAKLDDIQPIFCKCKEGAKGRTVTADFENQICDHCGGISK